MDKAIVGLAWWPEGRPTITQNRCCVTSVKSKAAMKLMRKKDEKQFVGGLSVWFCAAGV